MGIRFKLILGTSLLALLICAVGLYAASVARHALLESIEDNSGKQAVALLAELNRSLEASIDGWHIYADSLTVQQAARESNNQFEALPDVAAYLAEQDAAWLATPSGQLSPLMKRLESNQLADDLRQRINSIIQHKGHEIYSKVFVTNLYGAIIAQTSRASNYQQSNETWWQLTIQDGRYIGGLGYDENSKTYSIDICIRIDDPKGKPLGVIKSIQSIKSSIGLLQNWAANLRKDESRKSSHEAFILLDSAGKIIYSTRNPKIGLWSKITYPLPTDTDFTSADTVTFERDDKQAGPILASCAFSKAPLEFMLVVENPADQVLAPANHLRNSIIAMALGIAFVEVILGMILLVSISRRLARLSSAVIELGNGNLQARIADNCSDEIGRVSRCFNDMAESLMCSRRDIHNYTAEIELKNTSLEEINRVREEEIHRLAQTEEDLRRSQEVMNTILNSMPVGMVIIGRDKVIRQVNPAALRMMKQSSEDQVVGRTCSECFCTADEDECPIVYLKKAIDTGEHDLVAKDGSKIPVLKTVIPLRLGNEDVMLETFVDISYHKQVEEKLQNHFQELQEANRRLEALVSGSTEREIRMVQLKQEVNELRLRVGETPKYTAPTQISESGLHLAAAPDD